MGLPRVRAASEPCMRVSILRQGAGSLRNIDGLFARRVAVWMRLQILLPVNKVVLQMRVGTLAAKHPQARITDSPGTVTAQVSMDQIGGFLWRRQVPVQIKIK